MVNKKDKCVCGHKRKEHERVKCLIEQNRKLVVCLRDSTKRLKAQELATLKEVLKLINDIIDGVEIAGYESPQDNGYMNALQDIKEQIEAKIKEV
jgi:hypothetical protein